MPLSIAFSKKYEVIGIDNDRKRIKQLTNFIDHTNEHLIGTEKGVLKCRAIRRHDKSDQFDALLIAKLTGTPWRPVPGRNSMNIPTNIKENGTVLDESGNIDGYAEENENTEERFNPGIDVEEDEALKEKMEEEKARTQEKEK